MYEIVDADLQPIIRGLKRAFVKKKRETGNRHFVLNTKNSKTEEWIKVAELVKELNAHPDDWIEAAFLYAKAGPFVTTLHGKPMIGWWETLLAQKGGTISGRVAMHLSYFTDYLQRTAIEMGDSPQVLHDILMDDFNGIEPYIRVLFGQHIPEVGVKWGALARKTLAESTSLQNELVNKGYDITPWLN